MALVLEIIPGEDFYVRDVRFELVEIHNETACTVRRDRDGKAFRLSDTHKTEIAPGTLAFVGTRRQLGLARIAVEADRLIPVLRGHLYRKTSDPD